jgi:hypothetical protein
MREALEQKFVARWPTWFRTAGSPRLSPMARGFEHSAGWFNIFWKLCVDLEPPVTELEQETGVRSEVAQVKAKLGTIRFYVSHHTALIDDRFAEAQMESSRTCELCGQSGKQHATSGWIRAVREQHAK